MGGGEGWETVNSSNVSDKEAAALRLLLNSIEQYITKYVGQGDAACQQFPRVKYEAEPHWPSHSGGSRGAREPGQAELDWAQGGLNADR